MSDVSELYGQFEKLGDLEEGCVALVKYALSLKSSVLVHEAPRWVLRPENFVTFEPHYLRTRNLTVTLRGNPLEFVLCEELTLSNSMHGYSSFKLEDVSQFAAAFTYLRRAKDLFDRGRTRDQKQPTVVER